VALRRLGYATTRARVEARAALEQAEELGRVLEELGKRLRLDEEDAGRS
jgi:hypothetical protein